LAQVVGAEALWRPKLLPPGLFLGGLSTEPSLPICCHSGGQGGRGINPVAGRRQPQRASVTTDERGTAMSDNDRRGGNEGPNTGVVVKARPKTRKPPMYKVLMLNDDYTPMEFVVHVLERFFQKSREEATRIMLHVHRRGVGVCGVYTYEVAETKVTQVMDLARQNQHPLQCTIEKE
jgi:ATP-dependent Clp protease adaptor protein ClpS